MAGDDVASEDNACCVDNAEDGSLTMVDILEEQEALLEDAEAVLGAADDEHCTYAQDKMTTNVKNSYNQNFDGVYCTCHRPYPDPEQPDEDEMIQCCVCEDWYHTRHLERENVPAGQDYAEMICHLCIAAFPILSNYAALDVSHNESKEANAVDQEKAEELPAVSATEPELAGKSAAVTTTDSETAGIIETNSESAGVHETISKSAGKSEEKLKGPCTATVYAAPTNATKTLFLPENWRSKLCCCSQCTEQYQRLQLLFLTCPDDTTARYEQQSRDRLRGTARQRSVERELEALNAVDRVTRTEMVAEYNTLSTELREYLRKFANTGKVVRDEDIREFFSTLEARKKQRTTDGIPPNTCK
ncbi:putative E3 ubiquitin-protein ligase UBR7 isoform X2 [Hyalella azteca]|uniref:E3 ubiquitin-protein ligase UBR7 isoform X2 n=1 Tax=Hyalella azteca TaxID=294128 RepID=A0A979FLU5_HYAAZ|nr:putative E3 ubiquitin-protein ligase UBR7 isoform X2 [Hyalella azteca]